MTAARTSDLIASAASAASAVPAFNVITLEHAEAIVAGAERAGVPVLLQLSENAIGYHGGAVAPIALACAAVADAAAVPVAVHLDHVQDLVLADRVIDDAGRLGVSSIMIDAAALPYGENVGATSRYARRARDAGLWVEAELGEVGGKDGAHAPGVRTDPGEAESFVSATGVDGLAVAVGSSHAMTSRDAALDLDLIARLAARVPVPLVLHGSSGVPDDVISAAVAAGIRKVNVGTGLNIAFTRAVRERLGADASVTDPRKYLAPARSAVADAVAHLCAVIGGR